MTTSLKFTVWSIDVWGNADDGWEQNDYARQATLEIAAPATDADILALLKDHGLVDQHVALAWCDFEWWGDENEVDGQLSDARDGRPALQFRSVPHDQ